MEFRLVVAIPFGAFVRGDVVTDQGRVAQILSSEHARYVVRVAAATGKGN